MLVLHLLNLVPIQKQPLLLLISQLLLEAGAYAPYSKTTFVTVNLLL